MKFKKNEIVITHFNELGIIIHLNERLWGSSYIVKIIEGSAFNDSGDEVEYYEKQVRAHIDDWIYIPNFISKDITGSFKNQILSNIKWTDTVLNKDEEPYKLKRKMAYVYDKIVEYKYDGFTGIISQLWQSNTELFYIKSLIETKIPYKFNSVLLNHYKNGKDVIRYHSDKEPQLGDNPVIAMVNLGESRTFHLKNKTTKEHVSFLLNDGDLFIMKENCQPNWVHGILEEPDKKGDRLSLTFRLVTEEKF